MDELHATLHKASRAVTMDPHLKAGFRRTLEAMTDDVGVVAQPASFRVPRALAWALAAVIAATSGATVTFASSKAVPGDALYAVKVNALEPAERALAFSSEAKADVAVTHLERRFREAAELAAAGTLEDHDDQLAELAARDVAVVDNDDQPVARARFEALASAYGPALVRGKARFAAAVRIDHADEAVPDDLAQATAKQQLAIAQQKREGTSRTTGIAAVAKKLDASDRLSRAANEELGKGSFQEALELSGAAAKMATEAQLFATFVTDASTTTASTTSSTVTSPSSTEATTTTSIAPSASSTASTTPGTEPEDGFFRKLFR